MITNGTKGSEDGTITLRTAQNTVTEERYATITVAAGTLTRQVTVTQAAAAPMLNVDKTAIDATVAANSYPINVTSNLTWTAAVNSAATWCTLTNANATTGNGTVTVNVAENPTVETRTATVTLTSGTLTEAVVVTQGAAAPTLEVDKTTIDAAVAANSYPINVTSNLTWTATVSSDASWCTLTNAEASGNGTVTVGVAENPTIEVRTATVTVTSGTLTKAVAVTQGAAAPTLEVDKTTIDAAVAANSYPIGVTSNLTWTATVSSDASWCTLTNANASGNGTVTVNVAENPTIEVRTATVTVTSGTLTKAVAVTQGAAAPTLEVDKTTIDAAVAANSYPINVTSNLTWSAAVSSAATWCTLTNDNATGNGTVTVNVVENILFTTRSTTVTLTSGTLTKTVTVTQAAVAPVLEVDKTDIQAAATAAAYPVGVTSNLTWMATVNSGATWCTLTNDNATGNGTVTVNVTSNTVTVSRSATVTVKSGSLTQTVAVTQYAASPTLNVDKTAIQAIATAAAYTIGVTSNTTWTATINSGSTWCTLNNTNPSGNGTVMVNVAENKVVATRAATVTVRSGTLTKTVAVSQAALTLPPYAASTQTWTFGTQMWSDVINLPDCNKKSYDKYVPDCRNQIGTHPDETFYNWPYMTENANSLCPSPWRVPSKNDVLTLSDNASGALLRELWGKRSGVWNPPWMTPTCCYLWSISTDCHPTGHCTLSYEGDTPGLGDWTSADALMVRCVR
jgi:hypothetical protein